MANYKHLLLLLLTLFTGSVIAQNADTVYVFRFVTHKDMFYVPWKGNGTRLDSLLTLIEQHKTAILNGEAPLLIDGYCASESTKADNLKLAKTRSNRVKSELILGKGVKESCFITSNHAEPYGGFRQAVTVRLRLPRTAKVEESPVEEVAVQEVVQAPEVPAQKELAQEKSQTGATSETPFTALLPASGESGRPYGFALRANLLRWATLTPDLGVEWRFNRHWGIQVNGTWTSWSWDHKNRRYALWNISPEMRYYLGKRGQGFLGLMYHTGEFHYKLGYTGCQGDYQGGGLTGGYLLNLNRSFSLDLHAGVGYTYADSNEYTLINDVRVRKDSKTKNYWGINQLGITLIWKLLK